MTIEKGNLCKHFFPKYTLWLAFIGLECELFKYPLTAHVGLYIADGWHLCMEMEQFLHPLVIMASRIGNHDLLLPLRCFLMHILIQFKDSALREMERKVCRLRKWTSEARLISSVNGFFFVRVWNWFTVFVHFIFRAIFSHGLGMFYWWDVERLAFFFLEKWFWSVDTSVDNAILFQLTLPSFTSALFLMEAETDRKLV